MHQIYKVGIVYRSHTLIMMKPPTLIGYLTKECIRLNKMLNHVDLMPEHHEYEEHIFMRQYDIKHFACQDDPNIRALWFQRERRGDNLKMTVATTTTRYNVISFFFEEDFVPI